MKGSVLYAEGDLVVTNLRFTSVLTLAIDKAELLNRERRGECRNQMCLAIESFSGTTVAVLKATRESTEK